MGWVPTVRLACRTGEPCRGVVKAQVTKLLHEGRVPHHWSQRRCMPPWRKLSRGGSDGPTDLASTGGETMAMVWRGPLRGSQEWGGEGPDSLASTGGNGRSPAGFHAFWNSENTGLPVIEIPGTESGRGNKISGAAHCWMACEYVTDSAEIGGDVGDFFGIGGKVTFF